MDSSSANSEDTTSYMTEFDQPINWVPLSMTFVEYPHGSAFGKLLALSSLAPFAVLSGLATLIISFQDLHTLIFLVGVILNSICNKILKNIIREPRPAYRNTNVLYSEYGMPSSHSQFMWFVATFILCSTFINLQNSTNKGYTEVFWMVTVPVSFIAIACIVSYSRIFLQYHTWKQVNYGALFGIITGIIWFIIINLTLYLYFPSLEEERIFNLI